MEKSSLDRLAHIANLSHDLQQLNHSIENDEKREYAELEKREDSSDDPSSKPRRLACTQCRQQKSKCDARERHPLPCTRCMKKGIQCVTEKDFKRTDKRQRLASIERELKQLKDSFVNHSGDYLQMNTPLYAPSPLRIGASPFERSITPKDVAVGSPKPDLKLSERFPESFNFPGALKSPHTNGFLSPSHHPKPAPALSARSITPSAPAPTDFFCDEKSVGDITLKSALIRDLYVEYMNHYHPLLPVIDISKGPERIHRLCPALFWVIMFVALRRIDESKQLLLGLTPHIKNILAEITISPITRYNPTEEDEPIMNACSVYSVQAFLLYTLWPPLTSSLSADSSWNTIGVALFQAIRIGLHSSGGSNQPMAQEQTRTWILCNIVSQNIATAYGFPAFVQFDFLSAHHCNISTESRQIMELAHFEDQVAKTLNSGATSNTGVVNTNDRLALLKVLIKQLSDLEIKHSSETANDNGYTKFHSIVARIHLLTCYFLDAAHIPAFELSKGLVRLFNASVSLIEHVQMCEAKSKDFVKYLPSVQILNLWQASCLIVKLANSPLKSVIDIHASKEIYTQAIRLVAKASVLKHDIAYRASGIMRNMWQLFRTLDEKNMTGFVLKIKSRMMASVFFDCLSLMRDQVGMAKLNFKTDSGIREDSEDSGDEAIDSSEEESQPKVSVKSTPGSSGSSSTRRKKRTLSGNHDAESKARRIIRTIPLDPQPISASNRGSIFKVLNSDTSSPGLRPDESPLQDLPQHTSDAKNFDNKKEPHFSSLFHMNNESLWKDVDSLMNDFAFPG